MPTASNFTRIIAIGSANGRLKAQVQVSEVRTRAHATLLRHAGIEPCLHRCRVAVTGEAGACVPLRLLRQAVLERPLDIEVTGVTKHRRVALRLGTRVKGWTRPTAIDASAPIRRGPGKRTSRNSVFWVCNI